MSGWELRYVVTVAVTARSPGTSIQKSWNSIQLRRSAGMGQVTPFPRQNQTTAPHRDTVLVVEDDVLVRMATASELRERGFAVLEAYNAEEAVALLQAQIPVRLVFTDCSYRG